MGRSHIQLTPDELLSTIKRSQLPTLLVEGDDDIVVFRKLEELHADVSLSLLPSGGRSSLLEVFKRKGEVSNIRLGFIADRDSWVIAGVPEEYECPDLIFTKGYSIENDLFSDGDLFNMITVARRPLFLTDLENFIEWFSLQLTRYLRGEAPEMDVHVTAILDNPEYRQVRMQLKDDETYPTQLRQRIGDDYVNLVRGKNLMQLAIRHLSDNGNTLNALGIMQLVAHNRGPAMTRIFEAVALFFSPPKAEDPVVVT